MKSEGNIGGGVHIGGSEKKGGGFKKGSGAIPPNTDNKLDSLIDDIRADVGKDFLAGNAGAAITDLDGVTNEIKAYSKYNNSISNSNLNHKYS